MPTDNTPDTVPPTEASSDAAGKLVSAEEVENDCPTRLQQIGKEITARLAKADKKAQEANDHLIAVNQLLAEAKGLCDSDGFEKFRETFCPRLGRSQAYAMLAIAAGRKSIEGHRAEERGRKQRTRARQKEMESGTVPEKSEPALAVAGMNGASALPSPAMAWTPPAAPPPEPEAEAAEPTVEEAEAEVKRLKAERAALKDKIKVNGSTDGTSQESTRALAEFLSACKTWLPNMQGDDLQAAIDHFAEVVEVPALELMPDLKRLQFDLKIAKAEVTALKRKLAGKLPPRESRAAAWVRLAEEAGGCIEELINYQSEFEDAKEAQPEGLQEGPFAQKCEEVCGIDLETALSILEEAEGADLPQGFGRD